MSESGNGSKKFAAIELKPRWSVRINYTPNKGRDYFTVSYYDESHKRQRLVYSDRATAEAEAEKLRRKMDQGVAPGLVLSGRERVIYERALEAARLAGMDLDILAKDAAEARALLGTASLGEAAQCYVEHRVKLVQKTVSEVVEELLKDRIKNGKSEVYIRDLRLRLRSFAKAFKCGISSVTVQDIEKYLDLRGANGRYRKNLIDTIHTLFAYARSRNYVHRDHPGVGPITRPATQPREVRVFTPAEARKLLSGLPTKLIPVAAIGCFTAIRTAEIERMDWSQVNLSEGHIEVTARTAKKKVRRIVPVPRNLRLWLRPFAKPTGRVCPFKRLGNQWHKFAGRAGVQWSRNVHRDSGISYAVALNQNIPEVALISGNSPQIIQANYLKCVTNAEGLHGCAAPTLPLRLQRPVLGLCARQHR